MNLLNSLFYSIFIHGYFLALKIASIWNAKAKHWMEGRANCWDQLHSTDLKNCIWFHASSLGEFEQINYLIQVIRKESPKSKILVSFFSPSGYMVKKDYPHASLVTYLPFDFKSDVRRFIEIVQPKLVIWVRYEFWIHVLTALHEKKIPIILLNGVFRNQISAMYLPILKKALNQFSSIFVINANSQEVLKTLGYPSEVLSDTRYDRMFAIKNEPFQDLIVEHFTRDKKTIIFGSTWDEDERVISECNLNKVNLILVPHEIDCGHIDRIKLKFPKAVLYSEYDIATNLSNILIIDRIGLLSKIYRYGAINYVGGGFNKVVHSLIEPLAYGKPILIGPNIHKSEEAMELTREKLVAQVQNSAELEWQLNDLLLEDHPSDNQRRLLFFNNRLGSTNKLIVFIKKIVDF